MDKQVTVTQIVEALQSHGGELHGDGSISVQALAALEHARHGSLSFVNGPRYAAQMEQSQASCLIVPPAMLDAARREGRACIVTANPYAYYARVTQWWKQHMLPQPDYRIHPSAVVHPGAEVHPDAIIGPLCVVERGARIGAGSWLKSRVTISEDCSVGARCILHPGVVIGADGFGFAHENGQWVKIEQLGAVRIGDDVEIGANTCIDRGALDDTVIGNGVKMDNLIMIAHNVQIGEHTAMAANTGVAGSARIGAHCTIGGAANIAGHLTIADGIHITATSMVTRSLRKQGAYTGFFPLDDNATWEKNAAAVKSLHKLRDRVRALEQQLSDNKTPS